MPLGSGFISLSNQSTNTHTHNQIHNPHRAFSAAIPLSASPMNWQPSPQSSFHPSQFSHNPAIPMQQMSNAYQNPNHNINTSGLPSQYSSAPFLQSSNPLQSLNMNQNFTVQTPIASHPTPAQQLTNRSNFSTPTSLGFIGLTSPISGGHPLQCSCHHCGRQLNYPLTVESEKFPCPNCHQILTVHQVVRHAEESHYYQLLNQFNDHFNASNSALIWLSAAKPTRTGKLAVPRSFRWPKATAGKSGYAEAFQTLGLVLRKNDTASGHWHCWYVERSLVTFAALQSALKRRWKESPNYSQDTANEMIGNNSTNNNNSGLSNSNEEEISEKNIPAGATSFFTRRVFDCQ